MPLVRRRTSRKTSSIGTFILLFVVVMLAAGVAQTAGAGTLVSAIVLTFIVMALWSVFGPKRHRRTRRSH